MPPLPDYVPVGIVAIIAVIFSVLVMWLADRLSPRKPKPEKLSTYECGERPEGQAWSQFNVRFYIFALMFVIFDVETVFIFPWAVRLHWFRSMEMGLIIFLEMVIFIAVLLIGLAYAWKKGVLKWV